MSKSLVASLLTVSVLALAQPAYTAAPSPHTQYPQEYAFFKSYFDRKRNQQAGHALEREQAFALIVEHAEALQKRGAKISVGGMLALLTYEGVGRLAHYNTRCAENSYDKSAECWTNPKARYSYQLGLGAVHTSNFHPCRPPGGHPIRKYFEDIVRAEGFSPTAEQINSVAPDIQQFCHKAKPGAIDYYIIRIHDVFGIPKNGSGNALAQVGPYPFFSPSISIPLFFYPLERTSVPLSSDNTAIKVWGGGDKRYGRMERQEKILAPWRDFQRNWPSSRRK